jgi:ABC-2 type transport system permease protein
MRHLPTILSHEIRMLLVNPATYIAAVLFLSMMGFTFTAIIEDYTRATQESTPAIDFFQLFWLPVFFMVPLLTMKSISEERRLGTLETLLTSPVTTPEVVLGKFGAAYLLYISLWACTGAYFYILAKFSGDTRFIESGPLIGGYLFIATSGLLFIAIGIFASSLARNQAIAGIFSFSLLFLLILGFKAALSSEFLNREGLESVREILRQFQIFTHLEDFSHGIIDTRQVLFYISGTTLALLFSILGIEAKLLAS